MPATVPQARPTAWGREGGWRRSSTGSQGASSRLNGPVLEAARYLGRGHEAAAARPARTGGLPEGSILAGLFLLLLGPGYFVFLLSGTLFAGRYVLVAVLPGN